MSRFAPQLKRPEWRKSIFYEGFGSRDAAGHKRDLAFIRATLAEPQYAHLGPFPDLDAACEAAVERALVTGVWADALIASRAVTAYRNAAFAALHARRTA